MAQALRKFVWSTHLKNFKKNEAPLSRPFRVFYRFFSLADPNKKPWNNHKMTIHPWCNQLPSPKWIGTQQNSTPSNPQCAWHACDSYAALRRLRLETLESLEHETLWDSQHRWDWRPKLGKPQGRNEGQGIFEGNIVIKVNMFVKHGCSMIL